jgi:hypothetical protein
VNGVVLELAGAPVRRETPQIADTNLGGR